MFCTRKSRAKSVQERSSKRLSPLPLIFATLFTASNFLLGSVAAKAETNLSPFGVNGNPVVAQSVAPPQFIPTDTTPFTLNPERNSFNPGYKFKIFQALPERLWFNVTAEASQRLDTNVLFTARNPKADYAFRILPNVTVGYNIARNTSVYANYFVIKDSFAKLPFLNRPTTQSLSWGIQHNKRLGDKSSLQFNFQARELWQARNLHQFDFIPGVTLTHTLTPRSILYASVLLQMRGQSYFVAPTRELDPFYTIGYIRGMGSWTFIATDTLVTNFRHPTFKYSIPDQSNVTMIADLELNRPISKKFPSALAFVRAEPVFNWGAHRTPGLSGFDFRLYGGVRVILSKPSYYGQTQDMKKQLMRNTPPGANQMPNQAPPVTSPGGPASDPAAAPSVAPPAGSNNSSLNGQPDAISATPTPTAIPSASASSGQSMGGRLVMPPEPVQPMISPVNFIPGMGEAALMQPAM